MLDLKKSGNPIFKEDTFRPINFDREGQEVMSLQGTINKTGLLLLFVGVGAVYSWNYALKIETWETLKMYSIGCAIAAFVCAIVLNFKKEWAAYLAPAYSLLQGVSLGIISCLMDYIFPGIALQALTITMAIFGVMLLAYKFKLLQATPMFKKVVIISTIGIGVVYLISIGMRLFGAEMPFLHDNSPIGIGISLFIVVIAALNFILDFHYIEENVKNGAPKNMEWFAAFGLIVTLVWLYIEVLRLLSKLRSND